MQASKNLPKTSQPPVISNSLTTSGSIVTEESVTIFTFVILPIFLFLLLLIIQLITITIISKKY